MAEIIIATQNDLAQVLAQKAGDLKEELLIFFQASGYKKDSRECTDLFTAELRADAYAQTLTYGCLYAQWICIQEGHSAVNLDLILRSFLSSFLSIFFSPKL